MKETVLANNNFKDEYVNLTNSVKKRPGHFYQHYQENEETVIS